MSQIAYRKKSGTTSALSSLVGKVGEFAIDLTKKTLVIFDGAAAGGYPLSLENHTHANASDSTAGFESAADHIYLYTHTHAVATSIAAGFMSASDKNTLDSLASSSGTIPNSTANVPGTLVKRDGNGDFASRNISAALFIGTLQGNADTATNGVVTTGTYANPAWITSLSAAKLTGIIPSGVAFAGTIPWTSITGKPAVVSFFTNDSGYINGSGNTTGTAGGVLSSGGRETASPTANTVLIRDASGRSQVATPAASGDIANKAYVDANSGSVAYYPLSSINGGNTSNVGAQGPITIINESAAGQLYSMAFVLSPEIGDGLNNNLVGAQVFPPTVLVIEITIDGHTPFTSSLNDLAAQYGFNPGFIPGTANPLGTGTCYTIVLQMPYKISLLVRWSNLGYVRPGGGTATMGISLTRYLKA